MIRSDTMENPTGLAVIAARGGSKRIPRKNIRVFHGRPIIEYVIEACLQSGCFKEVMVSTDDEEIAEISRKAGAAVPFIRSAENSGDHAGIFAVLREVISAYANLGQSFEEACCLLPTAPFLTAEKLRQARVVLQQNPDGGLVFPVVPFAFPVQRGVFVRHNRVEMAQPEHFSTRSQDLEPCYHDAGQFYYLAASRLLQAASLSFQNAVPLLYPEAEVQDIDTESDWKLAELKFQLLRQTSLS